MITESEALKPCRALEMRFEQWEVSLADAFPQRITQNRAKNGLDSGIQTFAEHREERLSKETEALLMPFLRRSHKQSNAQIRFRHTNLAERLRRRFEHRR